ncbi:MAG: TIGR04552 family protein [Bdellovibrionota bacterium]
MDTLGISNFHFNRQVLDCVIGGVSSIDTPLLNIHTVEEAKQFIVAYGYDPDSVDDKELLWNIHRRAVALIQEQLLDPGETVLSDVGEPSQLGELSQLLILASSRKEEDREKQRWACAVLRVMHVFVHLRNDLFSAFRDEIQAQLLKPLQDAIVEDDISGSFMMGPNLPGGGIQLHKFEIKPFKATASSAIKLLARRERVALSLLDKLGVRFITRSLFDSFRVVKFLVDQHLISYPHIIPDQSANTLFPINLFLEVMEELKELEKRGEPIDNDAVKAALASHLQNSPDQAQYLEKMNEFSGPEYRFLKFINRKLVTVFLGDGAERKAFRFFYPYEIQIVDLETFSRNMSGPMAHDAYKDRQRRKARARVLGEHL